MKEKLISGGITLKNRSVNFLDVRKNLLLTFFLAYTRLYSVNIPKNRVQIIFSYYIIHVSKFGFSAVCASCRKNLCISIFPELNVL
jgi:hypothetical protein